MTPALRAVGLRRVFRTPAGDVVAVDDVSLDLHPGELVALRGRSGAGKTTLLTLLGGLDTPTDGHIRFEGQDLADPSTDLPALLGSRIASVFQDFRLLPILDAAENVEVPLRIRRTDPAERTRRVADALDAVGLAGHARQRPDELSGGQQQRVAIARALVMEPAVLLADEPTAQLDSETGAEIMELVSRLVHERGTAALVATHDPAMIARADRVLEIHDGRLAAVSLDPTEREPAEPPRASRSTTSPAAPQAPTSRRELRRRAAG